MEHFITRGEVWNIHSISAEELFLYKDNSVNSTLYIACRSGHLNVVKFIVKKLKKGNFLHLLLNEGNLDGNSPLHEAYFGGHQSIITFLESQAGIELKKANKRGFLPREVKWFPAGFDHPLLQQIHAAIPNSFQPDSRNEIEHENFRVFLESIKFDLQQYYQDRLLPTILFEGHFKNGLQNCWARTRVNAEGFSTLLGLSYFTLIQLIAGYQLASLIYLGYNRYDEEMVTAPLGCTELNEEYYTWLFNLFFRYYDRQRLYFPDERYAVEVMFRQFGPASSRSLQQYLVGGIPYRLASHPSFHSHPGSLPLSHTLLWKVKIEEQSDVDYLLMLKDLFPELNYYRDEVEDFTPDQTAFVALPNSSLFEAVFQVRMSNVRNTPAMVNHISEVNKLLVRLLYVRDLLRGTQRFFHLISAEEYETLQYFVLQMAKAAEDDASLYYLLMSLILDDLGRTSPIRSFVIAKEGRRNDYSHDSYLKRLLVLLQANPEEEEKLLPSLQLLREDQRGTYLQTIFSNFNLGAFVQGESVGRINLEFLQSGTPQSRAMRLTVAMLAFASFKINELHRAELFNPILHSQYVTAALFLSEPYHPEVHRSLPHFTQMIMQKNLNYRNHVVGFDFSTVTTNPKEIYALQRCVCLSRCLSNVQVREMVQAWMKLSTGTKETLIEGLSEEGLSQGSVAFMIYYAPAIIANTILSQQGDFHLGCYHAFQELAEVYRRIPDKLKSGQLTYEYDPSPSLVGNAVIYHGVTVAEKMKQLPYQKAANSTSEKAEIAGVVVVEDPVQAFRNRTPNQKLPVLTVVMGDDKEMKQLEDIEETPNK